MLQAVQDLRAQAQDSGNLNNTEQQRIVQSEEGIEIVPTNPELVYVPSYDSDLVYTSSASDWAAPLVSFGFGYALGSWLNTCFYWPDYSVVYGGPYYWGWGGRPYWNHYPSGWNQWGWNHWGPRNGGWNPNWNPSNGRFPNHMPPQQPMGSNPWNNTNSVASPWAPKNVQPVGWKHDNSRGGPFWGGGPNGGSWGRPMPSGDPNSGQKTWGSNPPSNGGNWGGWKNSGSSGSNPSNGNSGPKSWGSGFAPSRGPSNNGGSNPAPVSTMRMGGMNVKSANYSSPPAPIRTSNGAAPSPSSWNGGGRSGPSMSSPGFQKSMGGWGGGGGHVGYG